MKYGTGPYNDVLKASQFFGCLQSCSCGTQNLTFLGGITQTILIDTLKCCGSNDNCNSAKNSSLYTSFCNEAAATRSCYYGSDEKNLQIVNCGSPDYKYCGVRILQILNYNMPKQLLALDLIYF